MLIKLTMKLFAYYQACGVIIFCTVFFYKKENYQPSSGFLKKKAQSRKLHFQIRKLHENYSDPHVWRIPHYAYVHVIQYYLLSNEKLSNTTHNYTTNTRTMPPSIILGFSFSGS